LLGNNEEGRDGCWLGLCDWEGMGILGFDGVALKYLAYIPRQTIHIYYIRIRQIINLEFGCSFIRMQPQVAGHVSCFPETSVQAN